MLRDPAPELPSTPVPCESSTMTDRVVASGEGDDLGERRDVPFHAEHAVRDDQLAVAVLAAGERFLQLGHVRVLIDDLARRAGEAHRVDDRRVVQLVGEEGVPASARIGMTASFAFQQDA